MQTLNYLKGGPTAQRLYAGAVVDAETILSKYFYFPEIKEIYEDKAVYGAGSALSWLQGFEANYLKLQALSLTVSASDETINDTAESMSKKCNAMLHREISQMKERGKGIKARIERALFLDETISKTYSVNRVLHTVTKRELTSDEIAEGLLKLCKATWWRRQIKKQIAINLELAARELGLICKRKGGYCSNWTLRRRGYQRRSNKALLSKLLIENEIGQVFTLDEVSALSISHLPNRRAELMTRLSGFESFAENDTDTIYEAVFVTLTCPSRFHSHSRDGRRNPKWDESNPIDAQAYLNHVWRLTRTAWSDADITTFGFRIAEPHHDGCPHWHLILWFDASKLNHAMQLFRSYSLVDNGNERGADKRRFVAEVIDTREGRSATGYVAKYVSKNIDGLGEDGSAWSSDSVKTAMRVDAWCSTWSVRQFQQIGGAGVTVWRELRRLESPLSETEIEKVRLAADNADWALYTALMGGIGCKRVDRPLRPLQKLRSKPNQFGQVIRYVFGLISDITGSVIQTRIHEWHIRPREAAEQMISAVGNRAPPDLPLDLCQ